MKYTVEIIKKHEGFEVGQKKDLSLDAATHLKKKGIAKIVGEAPNVRKTAKKAEDIGIQVSKDLKSLDEKQNVRILALEDAIVELKILIEELSKKVEALKK